MMCDAGWWCDVMLFLMMCGKQEAKIPFKINGTFQTVSKREDLIV